MSTTPDESADAAPDADPDSALPGAGEAQAGKQTSGHRAPHVAYNTVKGFTAYRGTSRAAEVAFFAILSVFPGILVIAALLGFLSVDLREAAQQQVQEFLDGTLTSEAGGITDAIVSLFDTQRAGLLTFATLAALYSVSRTFQALIHALNIAQRVDDPRGWLMTRAIGLIMAIGTSLVIVALLGGLVVTPTLEDRLGIPPSFGLLSWLRVPTAFALAVLWVMTIYHFAPYRRTRWRTNFWGALVCAGLWIVFSLGFSLYVAVASAGNLVITTVGGGLVAIVWLYLMAIAVMVGAEFNYVLEHRTLTPLPRNSGSG